MALFLVQHGTALPEETDRQRVLSAQGTADVERIASVASGYGVRVDRIEHSGKTRARQTAEILAKHLAPPNGIHVRSGIGPNDDIVPLAKAMDPAADLMLVGHLPFLQKLCAYLVSGSVERPIFLFQNGGILCLDVDPQRRVWVIRWALMPHIG